MLSKLKNINFTFYKQNKFHFGQGKFEKIIKKENKQFERNQFYEESILQSKKEYTTNANTFVPLSDALDKEKKPKYIKQFTYDKEKIRKNLAKNYKKNIDIKKNEVYQYAKEQNEFLSSQLFSTELNKHYIDEVNAFKKLYFEKKETQRLIEEERLKPENILDNSGNNMQKGYDNNRELLQNIRIQDMMSFSKENKNLGLLIQSGLMNKEKNINQVIQQANALKNQQLQQQDQDQQLLNNNDFLNNSYQQEFQLKQGQINIQEQSTNQNEIILNSNDSNSNQLLQVQNLNNEDDMANMISNMGLKLKQDELKHVDFTVLKEFFQNFIETTPEEKIKTIGKIKLMQQIRDYEKFIFEDKRNNHITLRVKGRIQYKDMTLKESLNYIKYNIKNPEQIFQMFSQIKEIQEPEITAQMVQKLGSFRFSSKENVLSLIQQKNYKAIQRKFIDIADQIDHEHLIGSVYSFGKIHEHELGIVSPKLYKKLNQVCKQQVIERSEYLTFEELSFLTRGIVRLDIGKDKEVIENIIQSIKQHIFQEDSKEINFSEQNIYAIQGIINFLQYSDHPESPQIIFQLIQYLNNNKDIFEQEFDHFTLSDVIGGIFTLLIKYPKKNELKLMVSNLIKNYQKEILQHLPEIHVSEMKNLLILLNHIEYGNYKILREIKRETIERIKKTDHLFKQQDISQLVSGFAQQDLIRKNKKYLINKKDKHYNFHTLSEVNYIGQFFPKLIFPNSSPNYIIYSKLAKIANESMFLFTPKNLSLLVYGLSSVEYKNFEFYDNVVKYILSENEEDQDTKPKTTSIELLGMLLQQYSLTNRIDETLFKLIEYMKNIYMSMTYTKSTPFAWINYINTICNLRLLEDQKDIIEETQLIKVIYFDKIENYLINFSINTNLSLLYSLLSIEINDKEIIDNILDVLETQFEDYNNKLTPYQAVIVLQIKQLLKNLDQQNNQQQISTKQTNDDMFGDEADPFDMLDEEEDNITSNNNIKQQQLQQQNQYLKYLQNIQDDKMIVLYKEFENDLIDIIESKHIGDRFTYTQMIDQIKEILNIDMQYIYNDIPNEDIQIPVQFYIPSKNVALFLYCNEHFIYPFSEIQEDNTLKQIFQQKEKILIQNGIQVKRIYTKEFQIFNQQLERQQFLNELINDININ